VPKTAIKKLTPCQLYDRKVDIFMGQDQCAPRSHKNAIVKRPLTYLC